MYNTISSLFVWLDCDHRNLSTIASCLWQAELIVLLPDNWTHSVKKRYRYKVQVKIIVNCVLLYQIFNIWVYEGYIMFSSANNVTG